MNSKGHGGKRKGAGRKPKADELNLLETALKAVDKEYGSIEQLWIHVASKSKKSTPHLKMLVEYIYGKPKEIKDINLNTELPIFTGIDLDVQEDNGTK